MRKEKDETVGGNRYVISAPIVKKKDFLTEEEHWYLQRSMQDYRVLFREASVPPEEMERLFPEEDALALPSVANFEVEFVEEDGVIIYKIM